MVDDNEIYCRIVNGQVVEYPVYALHIRNRAHPFSMYTKVVFTTKPPLPDFAFYTEKLEVVNGIPLVTYGIAYKTLQTVLNELHQSNGAPTLPGEEPTPKPIEEVPPATMGRVVELAKQLVQDRLDNWAKTREYDGVLSAISYQTSTNPTRAEEGAKAVVNRDLSWDAMYAYMDKVMAKELPVPMKESEIVAQLPELTW